MYPLSKTSLPETHRSVLDNKVILVIGDGLIKRSSIRTMLANYGIKMILVTSKPTIIPLEDVYVYIQYDYSDHRHDKIHADQIIKKLSSADLSVDGCCTFTDACGPIAALVCAKLGLSGGVGITGAMNVWRKSSAHIYLQKQTDGVHHFPRTFHYTSRTATFTCNDTLNHAIMTVGFPAICKPEHGSHGEGVKLIRDEEELHHLSGTLDSLLKDGRSMMLMEYFGGTEHDIEVIIYGGEVIGALVSDNGPTRSGSYLETSMSMPSCLPQLKMSQLKAAASDCCIDVGLRNGVFNVEMKLTSTGPKLLEINGRMSGGYIPQWIYICYNIDLLWYTMAISAGIRPTIPMAKNNVHVMGVTCSVPVHQELLSHTDFGFKIDALIRSGEIQFFGNKYINITKNTSLKPVTVCNISVVKRDLGSAKSALLKVCTELGIHNELFDVPTYLSDFTQYQ